MLQTRYLGPSDNQDCVINIIIITYIFRNTCTFMTGFIFGTFSARVIWVWTPGCELIFPCPHKQVIFIITLVFKKQFGCIHMYISPHNINTDSKVQEVWKHGNTTRWFGSNPKSVHLIPDMGITVTIIDESPEIKPKNRYLIMVSIPLWRSRGVMVH